MTETTYYGLNIVEGNDIVNPLNVDNPNYERIDEVMHDNAAAGVTLATEIGNGTVHALSRANSECAVIRFIATTDWKKGDTVTVDGVPVTALLPSGETLPDGAYVINANVLCILTGTVLTVYAERAKSDSADKITYGDSTVAAALNNINTVNRPIFRPNATVTQGNLAIAEKNGILSIDARLIINENMAAWSNVLIGTVSGWSYGDKQFTVQSLYNNPIISIALGISEDGTAYLTSHAPQTTVGTWLYGGQAYVL